MKENTPPASPFNNDDEELVYVGDNIDEVIEHLEEIPDNEMEDVEEGKNELNFEMTHSISCEFFRRGHGR